MEEKQKEKLINLVTQIKAYVVTEKTSKLYEKAENQYAFIVDPSLKKTELKPLLEMLFSVKIEKIRTLNLHHAKKRIGKYMGKKAKSKKVYITLKENQKISNLFN